jgi:glycosyltransferase involved in cell wall biosynthesis
MYGFTVRGWSAWGDQPAVAVAVSLNGVVVGRAAVGSESRRDVADRLASPCLAGAGWTLEVDASRFDAGADAELSVTVWGDPACPPAELERFTIKVGASVDDATDGLPPGFLGTLEEPCSDEQVGRVLVVRGWMVHRDAPVARLDVVVNGHWAGAARMGVARPDVAEEHPGPESAISGFEHWADLSTIPTEPYTPYLNVQVIARLRGGDAIPLFQRHVHVVPVEDISDRPVRRASASLTGAATASRARLSRSDDLNLLVFTHQLDYGGGQLWLDEFLQKSGAGSRYPCSVVSYRGGPLRQAMEQRGIKVHVTTAPPADDFEQYEGRISELIAFIAGGGQNVALVNTAVVFGGADVTTRLSIPTVWGIHESLTPDVLLAVAYGGRVDPDVRNAARRSMTGSDAIVFEAEATRQLYSRWAAPGRTTVISYGVDTQVIERYCSRVSQLEARAAVGVPSDARVLLVMGTIEPRKAQTRIAQAFSLVAKEHCDWTLVFVGDTNSPYSRTLRYYLRAVGLHDRCLVVPVDEDAYRWYRAADVLLSASDMESLPRSMLEVMCFGTAVMSASVFGIPQLLRDEETGFLFDANDLDAMVDALHRVLSLGDTRLAEIGGAGRCHVLEHYDSAGYVADLMTLLSGYVREKDARPDDILSHNGPMMERRAAHTLATTLEHKGTTR